MNKIILIIQREYLTRVKKKSFLVTTLLIPILGAVLLSSMIFLASKSEESQTIVVQDESGIFEGKLKVKAKAYTVLYSKPNGNESNKEILTRLDADILVHIFPFKNNKPDSILIFKEGGVSLSAKDFIGYQLESIYQVKLMEDAGINKQQIDSINSSTLSIKSYDLENNKETNSEIASGIGYVMGFLIYFIIFIYGAGVMRGVMEEKTNRIAEVIVSSVKPFQLMMGKIIGIGLVGLTQFGLWGIIMVVLRLVLPMFIPSLGMDSLSAGVNVGAHEMEAMRSIDDSQKMQFLQAVMNQNWSLILGSFFFYFLGGYFLYASMFAAVGSLVNEDPQEAQQLTLPITMPIIFGFIIMGITVKDPNSGLSVFGSLFPLTSPIVMLARIPYGVPVWQLILSMVLLVGGFLLMTWLSAKIYRTGILLYGKKTSWKEIIKWIRYS